ATCALSCPRFRFPGLLLIRWPGGVVRWRRLRRILPPAVTLNFFFAELCRFIFGISFDSRVLGRAQQHHHVAAVEERLRLDLADLLQLLGEAEEQVAAAFRGGVSRPRDLILNFTLARWLRKRWTCPFLVL